MAKKQGKKEKSIEESLWESANKLRGSVEPSEYKHVVLSLIFLKYANDCFVERRAQLIAKGEERYVDEAAFYTATNVFYLTEHSRWSYLMEHAKQPDIAIKIDAALSEVEQKNETLKGALPSNYYSSLGLDQTKLSALLDEINKIDTLKDREHDLIGRVYEYFLSKFAIAEGKVLHPEEHRQSDCRDDTALRGEDIRPLLWFGRYVCAEHEVYRGAPW